jgi:hypothetical protein
VAAIRQERLSRGVAVPEGFDEQAELIWSNLHTRSRRWRRPDARNIVTRRRDIRPKQVVGVDSALALVSVAGCPAYCFSMA